MTSSEQLEKPVPESRVELHDDILVTGSLANAIWIMAWPLILSTSASAIVGFTDVYVSGSLGCAAQAAVGVSEQVLFMFIVLIMSMATGTTAVVSRAAGANDHDKVINAAGQSVGLACLMGTILAVSAFFIAGFGVRLVSASPSVVAYARLYLSIYSCGLFPLSIIALASAVFRALGKARIPLMIVMTTTIINVLLDYLTVFCNWPVPGLGIKGIAIAGVFAGTVGSIIALASLKNTSLAACFTRVWPLSGQYFLRIVKIGIPTALQNLVRVAGSLLLFFILAHCCNPTSALASWSIGIRVEAFVFMPVFALSLSVASIAGQSLGAKQPERAIKAGLHVAYIGVAFMVVLGSCLFIFANQIAHFMTKDPFAIIYTKQYLQWNALSEPFLAIGMVLSGVLQGSGDTRSPMWISFFSNCAIRLPLAWLLALVIGLGPKGAWMSMACSIIVSSILIAWRFQSRRWVTIKV